MSYSTDALRIIILVGLASGACLHIAVMVVPNWWYFHYGYWVQDTTGVERLNGGLFQVCQYERKTLGALYTCADYGKGPTGLKDTSEGLQPDSALQPMAQGFTVAGLLPSLPVVIMISLTFRFFPARKQLLTLISTGLMFLQSLLMVGAVGVAHEWIIQPLCEDCDWRELYSYEWCFYAACALIGVYMVCALIGLGTLYMDRQELIETAHKERTQADDDALPGGYKQASSVEYGP